MARPLSSVTNRLACVVSGIAAAHGALAMLGSAWREGVASGLTGGGSGFAGPMGAPVAGPIDERGGICAPAPPTPTIGFNGGSPPIGAPLGPLPAK